MKVWITKYALTKGIFVTEVEPPSGTTEMVVEKPANGFSQYYHGEGREWHRAEFSAVSRANQMRDDKILSLKKQLARLEKLKFRTSEDTTKP